MKSTKPLLCLVVIILAATFFPPASVIADESLALYGPKGYAYTFSPLPADGFYVQVGGMYSMFDGKLEDRDGYIVAVPVSLTYGDGNIWEFALSSHWEYWENTDLDMDERGIGDVFASGKFRLLGAENGMPLDLSLMPYILVPTGSRDKGIGDLYNFNPSPDDDFSYGLNLLLGGQLKRFYISANMGINFADTGITWIESSSFIVGLAGEYQICESLTSYVEFINIENKLDFDCDPCADTYSEDDIREIGAGLVWIYNKWGFKLHAGTGFTDTSPNFRGLGLINLRF
jgi:hypothetical protein